MANPRGNPQWQPGQSGNPKGRPKRPFDKALWIELCTDGLEDDGSPKKLRRIAKKLITCALAGEAWAGTAIMERLDGKVPQAIVGDEDGGPLQVIIKQYVLNADDKPSE